MTINIYSLLKMQSILKRIKHIKKSSKEKYSLVNLTPSQQLMIDKDISKETLLISKKESFFKKIFLITQMIVFLYLCLLLFL